MFFYIEMRLSRLANARVSPSPDHRGVSNDEQHRGNQDD